MEQWVLMTKRADFNKIASQYGISPVLARLLRNRDIITEEEIGSYLYGSLNDLPSPLLLKDVEKAADLILYKIKEGKKI
ncbi:MAG: single-stranded-DNA-specific exonuclease RecJ, partial [Eubacterium sp.]|nr:single-stranded-DNA-specific exonuclease RecJ [Eubacterium sp.]